MKQNIHWRYRVLINKNVVLVLDNHTRKMNIFFNKALHYLDKGQYMEGEKLLNQAIESSVNKYEVIEIQACRAELLYEMGKYVEAEKCINYVLENTSEDECAFERETVNEIDKSIRSMS